MPGLPRQEAGGGGGVAGVLLVAERDHPHAFGLRHAREVGDRDAGQAEDRVDVVELQRIDDEVEAVGRSSVCASFVMLGCLVGCSVRCGLHVMARCRRVVWRRRRLSIGIGSAFAR